MILTPNSPQVFALRLIVQGLLVRQFESAVVGGGSAETELRALLKGSLSGIDGISVDGGKDDGRTDELRRQIAKEVESIFTGVAENAAGIDALMEKARTCAGVEG